MKALISIQYSEERFKGMVECAICLEEYQHGESFVTPLPCNKLHVFHTACIKEWIEHDDVCPLCKKQVMLGDCKSLQKDFNEVYPFNQSIA